MFEEWIAEHCEIGSRSFRETTQALYASYLDWCARNTRQILPHDVHSFAKCLSSIGCKRILIANYDHSIRKRGYRGIRLRSSEHARTVC